MELPELTEHALLISTVIFAIASIVLLVLNIRTEKLLRKKEKAQNQKIYQISMLKEIQDRVSYSLDVEKVVDVITASLKKLFSYSTASSLVIREDKLVFKAHIEESVSHAFLAHVKNSMLASLSALIENPPEKTEDQFLGEALDDSNNLSLASFFHIPLIVNNKVVGLINVSSTKPNLYKEDEMTILYQITSQASSALSKLEEVIKNEEEKLASTIGSLADGVFMVDTKNQVLVINSAAKKFLNLQSKDPTYVEIINATSGKYDIQGKVNEAISQNKEIWEKEVSINHKFFQTFITPVHVASGEKEEVVGASVLLHDITMEKEISKIKEDFTNMMVHELRAPLTAIKYSSEVLIDTDNLETSEKKQLLTIINQQSKTLLSEINSILDAAKMESGKFTVDPVLADMKSVVEKTIFTFKSQADKKHIQLTLLGFDPLPQFEFDPLRIAQVLINLISNSLKFTPESGKITIGAKVNKDTRELIISVSDNGIGIPKNEQQDLFSKFYQIRKTPNELSKGGTGLGLYIVKGIAQAHNGRVWVDSEEGQGTTISFSIPLLKESASEEKEYQKISIPPVAYKTIN
jgi:signal transduction histidine kinase